MSPTFQAELVAWLATFAVHSTLLFLIALATTRRLTERVPDRAERIWTVALVAGLVTATLQARTLGPRFTLGSWASEAGVARTHAPDAPCGPASSSTAVEATPTCSETTIVAASETAAGPAVRNPAEGGSDRATFAPRPGHVLTLWALGAVAGLVALAAAYAAFLRRLRYRRPLDGAPARELADLARAAGVAAPRLTVSDALAAPVGFMLPRPEICLPERVVGELDPSGRRAILAHELAHLVRRDPLRLLGWRALEALFFFQPLLRIGRRRLVALSETLCDEWAVGRTGDRRELARTLARVAGWVRGPEPAPVAQMAACRSSLGRRVERLLQPVQRGPSRTPTALALVGLVVVAMTGPGFACRAPEAASDAAPGGPAVTDVDARALELLDSLALELDLMSSQIATLIDQVEADQPETALRLRDLDARLRTLRDRRDRLETTLSRRVSQP